MSDQSGYRPIDTAADPDAMARLMYHAFAAPREAFPVYRAQAGDANLRVIRENGAPAAMLARIPMGQFFGGRAVPMTGIAAVAVAPEARGRGLATAIMRATLRESREQGVPLSALYPATQPLYRRVGYEQAGHAFEARLGLARIDTRGGLPVRALREADIPMVRDLYRRTAAAFDGHLDRGDYVWGRVHSPWGGPTAGFVAESAAGIEGYVFLRQDRNAAALRAPHEVRLFDLCAPTPDAGRGLLRFLGEFASTAAEAVFLCGPMHPILMHLAEQKVRIEHKDYWMLRLVDVAAALAARGYPPGLSADVHLEVEDAVLPENAGRYVLRVRDGRGTAERGGEGRLKMDVGALAAAYSGYLTPRALAMLGRASGRDADLAAAGAAFGGGTPWMPDFF